MKTIAIPAHKREKLVELCRWFAAAPRWVHFYDSFYETIQEKFDELTEDANEEFSNIEWDTHTNQLVGCMYNEKTGTYDQVMFVSEKY